MLLKKYSIVVFIKVLTLFFVAVVNRRFNYNSCKTIAKPARPI